MTQNLNPPLSIVVLLSGSGSNLQAIIDSIQSGSLNAKIECVLSNKAEAYGLIRAGQAGIPNIVINKIPSQTREQYDQLLIEAISPYQPDLIVLAGFMRILSPVFTQHFANRIINIHPSLLPKYRGMNTHQRVLEAKDPDHGATIHFVTEGLDEGPIIAHTKVSVSKNDSINKLKQRVLEQEHYLYPEVLRWFAASRLRLIDSQVYLDGQPLSARGYEIYVDDTKAKNQLPCR